ncbi:cell filamentation protein Fic [Candidatus Desantisbacteria bacterium CG_4_10_14_0_8_um_filter_48_22]|uniref:Cell filamentation protein Fic n=1 Tax=Candidatus Desantisbacteria bacterium CG_4_10_14_0_8_um_filter_48_22 TaxID=1974543 RepID=A0A2M7SET2_9BACT|nr:MAG: cell filamentation protein Fic [Candidatus Desantisbacteria bacterium CG1_02_49_89]PIZ17823.1 MAG: cell filamentation protein Fic [Candidatus Desantisbacteria bacterium CG_4_10_14_0_8_um_filter_48_22]
MRSIEDGFLKKLEFPAGILSDIRAIGEYRGREALFARQSPETLEKLLESAIIQSAESSNRIEGVFAPLKRIKELVEKGAQPRTRPEQEIAGYRDALNLIHSGYKDIPVSEETILKLHSMIYRYTAVQSGAWKKWDNEIVEIKPNGSKTVRFRPVSAEDTPLFMNKLLSLYNNRVKEEFPDPVILIPLFILDLLCIHPFLDGNGRIARLLTLLLLYKAGYGVGRYISLERITETTRKNYYEVLLRSSQGWQEGRHDVFPWLRYFYGTLIAAYKEFESRFAAFKGKGSKTEQVRSAVEGSIKPFSIADVENACPNVTRDMIRIVLHRLRDDGKIKSTGIGRSAKWVKIG